MATMLPDNPAPDAVLPTGADVLISDAEQQLKASELARTVAESHKRAKQRRRRRDLTAEMYAIHIDGEDDAQWKTIINGARIGPEPNLDGSIRAQTNLLLPIIDNTVAYHTANGYRVLAESKNDRASRDRAMIDTIWANSLLEEQRGNELFAEALYLAIPYGHCPVHATWREDIRYDLYNPIAYTGQQQPQQMGGVRPGRIDWWVGDPWGTVYNSGATRRSIQWSSYERVLPVDTVKQAFGHVPGIETLKGRKDLPSASRFQRMVRRWGHQRLSHGTATVDGGQDGDETVALLCRELAPGIDPNWPQGRLTIVALSGVAELEDGSIGTPMLLHDDVLPGGRFSFVRVYPSHRYDDVLGAPWVAKLDELQVRRNNLETLLLNGGVRSSKPQLAAPVGSVDDDTAAFVPDGILEVTGSILPGYLEYPTAWMNAIEERLQKTEEAMFRLGGWQAASRGEANAGDPYSKVVMLSQADDTVHGPVNRALQSGVCELLQISHGLTKHFGGPFPIPVQTAGDEYGYLANSYVYAQQLSDTPPRFVMTNGFGASKEVLAQQLLSLVGMVGGDGQPIMPTRQFRRSYPDKSLWPTATDVQDAKERRAKAIAQEIRDAAQAVQQPPNMPPEWAEQFVEQSAVQLFTQNYRTGPMGVTGRWKIRRDDDLQAFLDALSEITQDETENPVARRTAELLQEQYYAWQAMMAMAMPAMTAPSGGGPSQATPGQSVIGSGETDATYPARVDPIQPTGAAQAPQQGAA